MNTAKEEVRRLLDQLPEDASLEDIQYQLYVRQKIQQGIQDVRDGKVLSHQEVEERMARWLAK